MDSAGTVVTQFAVFVYLNDTIFLQGMQIFHLSVIRKKVPERRLNRTYAFFYDNLRITHCRRGLMKFKKINR